MTGTLPTELDKLQARKCVNVGKSNWYLSTKVYE